MFFSRTEVPKLVQTVMRGEMDLDPYITHNIKVKRKFKLFRLFFTKLKGKSLDFQGLAGVNDAIEALHSGSCLRAVVQIASNEMPQVRTRFPKYYLIDKNN